MTHKMLRLKPSTLKFDYTYQRSVIPGHLGRLAAEFDPSLTGALVVSRRDDGDYVIDGQHRAMAAIEAGRGDVALDCVVHLGLDRATEASLFLELNRKRKAVGRQSEWGAAIVAGDPAVIAQAEAVERAGWKVNPNASGVGQISAVVALARLRSFDPDGERDLTYRTLRMLTDAWGMDKEVANGHLIEGAGVFMHRFGDDVDAGEVARRLRSVTDPRSMIGEARAYRHALGGSLVNAVGAKIHGYFNSNRRTKRLPAW